MKRHLLLHHILPACLFFCLVVLFLVSMAVSRTVPEIESVSPGQVSSGELMVISGRNFGADRNKSRVLLDDFPLAASLIEYWSDDTLKVRIPPLSSSGLVYIETSGGRSEGALFIYSDRIPGLNSGAFLPGKPYLSHINSSRFRPGELVILNGDKLGNRRKNSRILVSLSGRAPENLLDQPDESQFLSVPEESLSFWENGRIAFYLPDDARSGPVYVKTGAGYSNPVSIDVERPGEILLSDSRELTIRQTVSAGHIGALPGNSLALWIPAPADRVGQSSRLISRNREPVRTDGSLQVYRVDELTSGITYDIESEYGLLLNRTEIRLEKSDIPRSYDNPSMLEHWLRDEPDLPASSFRRTASAVVKRESNPYQKARLLYDYVVWKMHPDGENPETDPASWLKTRKADSLGYASLLTCLARAADVPARVVSGVWVTPDGAAAVPHHWTEFYLPGFGWYPADAAAADGILSDRMIEGADAPGGWGELDNGYISFSRGRLESRPYEDIPRTVEKSSYSRQSVFEEWLGNLDSCSTNWIDIAIIGP